MGTDVDLTCDPPHDDPVRLEGRIAWAEARDVATRRATTQHGIWLPQFPEALFQRLLDRSSREPHDALAGRPGLPAEKVGQHPGNDTVWLTGNRDAKRTGILIVDDDPGLLGSVSAVLDLIGYPAFPARSGRELERFGRAGLDGFLYKPLGVPQWVGSIEQLLAR